MIWGVPPFSETPKLTVFFRQKDAGKSTYFLEKKKSWQAKSAVQPSGETSFFSTSLPKFLYLSSFEARKPVVTCVKTPTKEVTTSLSLGCFLQVPSSTANRALLALSWDTLASISCSSDERFPRNLGYSDMTPNGSKKKTHHTGKVQLLRCVLAILFLNQ